MVRPVTAGVDGSPESMAAAEWAAAEAVSRRLPLRLLHARKWQAGNEQLTIGVSADESWADTRISLAAERVTERFPELEWTSESRADAPVRVLLDAAAESELLVVGSRGLGGLAGFFVGSVSQAVIAHASRPVAVVRGETAPETGPERPVVVGLDLQHHHAAVLEYAFEAAARRGSPLRAVHTWSLQALYAYPSALPDPEVAVAVREEAHRNALAALAPVREAFPEVDAELVLLSGAAAPELLAASEDAGLVVVGRRSRKRLSLGTHIGPVTHAVLHHVKQPVTVVPYE